MAKYLLKVIKLEEIDEDICTARMLMNVPKYDQVLFNGQMSADSAVEVINHLYQLEREEK